MMDTTSPNARQQNHRGPEHATHPEWTLRRESALWVDGRATWPNLIEVSAELRGWLQQKGPGLQWTRGRTLRALDAPANKFTDHASALAAMVAAAINDAFEFAEREDAASVVDSEIERLRLYNELVLYSVRFCEAAIKQMLYCTNVPERLYGRATMGHLLAQPCPACKKPDGHDISLLGSLAHHYWLCQAIDHCVVSHLSLLARRRNLEVAHAELNEEVAVDTSDSRRLMKRDVIAIGYELGHMADHLGEIEGRMVAEIGAYISAAPGAPDRAVLLRIPVRPLQPAPSVCSAQTTEDPPDPAASTTGT